MRRGLLTKFAMEKLNPEQREAVKKLSNERLRAKCVKSGLDEETVFAAEWTELLNLLAELMVNPQPAVIAETIRTEELQSRELSIKEQELRVA